MTGVQTCALPISSAREAGEEIVSRYLKQNETNEEAYGLSLIDLERAAALGPAVNGLFGRLEERVLSGDFPTVSKLREGRWDYARSSIGTEYDLVDLKELAEESKDGEVLAALSDCVVMYQGNRERAHGLSVYFPQKADETRRNGWQGVLESLSPGDSWLSFIRSYEEVLRDGRKVVPKAAETADRPYTIRLTDDQLKDFASDRKSVV